jgi:thiol-disulfide isomerase/thioredoxin
MGRLTLAGALAGVPGAGGAVEREAPHGEATEHGEAAKSESTADPTSRERSGVYVHRWIGMPALTGRDLESGESVSIVPEKGRMQVILFLASWCEPCQHMVTSFRKTAERYAALHVDFVYVFAHDTKDDALGFLKEYKLTGADQRGILANHDILKAFHNPELPTIYIGDRHGWMATRLVKASAPELARLDELLRYLTAY